VYYEYGYITIISITYSYTYLCFVIDKNVKLLLVLRLYSYIPVKVLERQHKRPTKLAL